MTSIIKKRFLESLETKPIVSDGAMGTMLYQAGFEYNQSFDILNLTEKDIIQNIHLEYIKSGSRLIETNSFGANFFRLAKFGHQDKVREINIRSVKIAREAREISGEDVWVAGAVGPLGKPIEPFGNINLQEAESAFKQQIEALVEGGVDVLLFETFSNLSEVEIAIRVAKELSDLPLIVNMTYTEDQETPYGNKPELVIKKMEEFDVDIIGANCSVGPLYLVELMKKMRSLTDRKLAVMPNAGFPKFVNGRYVYHSTPDYFAVLSGNFADIGVNVIGGCCGTTPEHIQAIAQNLNKKFPESIEINVREDRYRQLDQDSLDGSESELSKKLKAKKFVISAEVSPPKGINPEKVLAGAKLLKDSGCDSINVADSPMARLRMDCKSMAHLIEHQVGIETIIHFTSRDRNLMGLQADLLGAYALGIRNVLSVTGDPPSMGDYPDASAVYDTDAIGVCKILKQMNSGSDLIGKSIGAPTNYCYGVAVNPVADDINYELKRFDEKLKNGAMFAQTQPFFNLREIEKFLKLTESYKIPIMIGILPLHSHRHAEFLHNEVPGINIPDDTRKRMKDAGENGLEEGIKIATELLEQCLKEINGVYLMPSFGRYDVMAEVVKNIRLKRNEISVS